MQKRNWITVILVVLFTNCFSTNEHVNIYGTINPKYNGQIVQLRTRIDTIEVIATDTVKDGHFYLHTQPYPEQISYLFIFNKENLKKVNVFLRPILESGSININISDTASHPSTITGTYLNDEAEGFRDSCQAVYRKYKDNDYATYEYNLKQYIKSFFTKHNNDMAGYKIFSGNIATNDLNMPEYYNILSERLKQMPEIKDIWDSYKKGERAMKQLGKKVADWEFMDKEGKAKKISDYIGKSDFLFIDFWASWCSPCREGIQDIKKSYQKCKEKGLSVLGISLDENTGAWTRALNQENMPWEQLIIKNPNERKTVMDTYNMTGIPYTLLLDKNGYVLFVNLQGRSLESWVDNYSRIKK